MPVLMKDQTQSLNRTQRQFIVSQVDPRGREAFCLQNLWKSIRTEQLFIHPQVNAQWISKQDNRQSHLRRHEFIHKKEKRFHCLVCGDGFRSKSELHYHGKQHSEGIHSACALCDQPFRLVEDLEKHLKWHIQSDGFRSKSGLHNHEKKHSEGNQSVCALCDQPFGLMEDLEKHLKWHMNSEVEKEPSDFEVPRADDGYALPKLDGIEVLIDHKGSTESGETTPLTDIIQGYTKSDSETGGAPDQIEVSEDGGTVRKGKNSRGHCQQKKRFTCDVCRKSLSTKQRLQSHEFTHTGEKPFSCRICGKSFAQSHGFQSKAGLHNHEKKHSKENQSTCALCGQPFRLVEDLEKHLKWHIQSGS
ncbi:unnamed protein product [Cyprideis torosa]|uniref:Uncharacterized protein n=1 Tax=Cyprideis torosa TaxID=163714 RepID=A0A7R8WIM8_9CRUS|nr:unnamed protein product [Cyprideis torosa]CAG0900978.1 unnamed protein product [Cyprideis torosa]